RRDKVAGMAEAVKVALIRDEAFFDWLVEHRDALAACEPAALEVLVRRCAELHMRHIATSGDAFEFGSARPLDFGHWAAHKLESLTDYRLRHGEAVAIGIGLDTLYSALAGFMSMNDAEAVLDLIAGLGLPLWDDALDARGADDPRRARLGPRARRRRADRHAPPGNRPRLRGERDGRGAHRGSARPAAGGESAAGRAARFPAARRAPGRTRPTRGDSPMRLEAPGRPHLTYCTNIHPGETWAEVRRNLEAYVVPTARRVAGGRPFGVGLRLSGVAAAELARGDELDRLRDFLAAHDLYVFTINGFPYGPFHGTPVKEQVYLPDWLDPERIAYTNRLADLLAALLPDGVDGTISTVPGAFAPRVSGDDVAARLAAAIA